MQMADSLRDNPLRFTITNGITMDVEVTKSDLKTIVSKNTQDNRFNAFKNKLAQDIRGFLEKAQYTYDVVRNYNDLRDIITK